MLSHSDVSSESQRSPEQAASHGFSEHAGALDFLRQGTLGRLTERLLMSVSGDEGVQHFINAEQQKDIYRSEQV